ncbi:MAG TPA: zinc finger domain-containing protein, partial [Phycisphaerae bacterium]|nr:zinc finger domain-containing protein [Phycisphaerae bacterium]
GKRIWLRSEDDLYLIVHLMIAGRFLWKAPGARPPGKISLAKFDFDGLSLVLTEAAKQKRASLHLVRGAAELRAHDPGGVEPIGMSVSMLAELLHRENHTVKRSLCDPRLIAGIGNAYSDEILHAARLSPIKLTGRLTDEEIGRLHEAMQRTLTEWRDRLLERFSRRFPGPGEITAFRPEFAAHGKFGKPCPACGAKIQRIRYADNETNYCPRCQTGGKLLADRSMSRLLREDWPKFIDD